MRNVVHDCAMPTVNSREAIEDPSNGTNFDFRGPQELALLETRPVSRRDRGDLSYMRPLTLDPARVEMARSMRGEAAAGA